MGKHINKAYPLRISNDLQAKIEYIAKKEDRKIIQQYERIIRTYVEQYEATYGELTIGEDGKAHPKQSSPNSKSGKSSTFKVG